MKKMVWVSILLLLIMAVLAGCTQHSTPKTEDAEEDGYRRDNTDYEASKTITSDEMVSFECFFSTVPFEETDTGLECGSYRFSAVLSKDQVTGKYRMLSRYGDEIQEEFLADAAFMQHLQTIVKEYSLAENNGHYVEVKGLPDMYGAELDVVYASGETISAYDNEDGFLSLAAMEAIEELFRKQWENTESVKQEEVLQEDWEPEFLDVTIEEKSLMENVEGCFLTVTYPEISLGSPDDGENLPEEYETLQGILDDYNTTVRMNQESKLHNTLRSAAKQLTADEEKVQELYSYTNACVTRSDEKVLSFYEHIFWYEWWLEEQEFWETHNYDVKTGRMLGYDDIFSSKERLPELLAKSFQEAYPEIGFYENMNELIEEAVREEEVSLCFALGHEGIHFFAANRWLAGYRGGLHIMLPYAQYPDLIKPEYQNTSGNWIMDLEYGAVYRFENIGSFHMNWIRSCENAEDIEWTVSVNGNTYTENFYGYQPKCRLISRDRAYYIYLEVPTGDISFAVKVYRITEQGIETVGQIPYAFHKKRNLNPEKILMYDGEPEFENESLVIPCSWYCAGEDGMPVRIGAIE
ncbi:MAG: hypothetical protein IKC46_14930 [Lachnospiraceae bacterium]|nr:hypothetical protein [Lachnospiraceae bacterium]